MKKLILISALMFSFNGWALSDYQPYDEAADANQDIADAMLLADESKKYILLTMGGNWCPDCRTLGEYFARKDIKDWLMSLGMTMKKLLVLCLKAEVISVTL